MHLTVLYENQKKLYFLEDPDINGGISTWKGEFEFDVSGLI
jgi:hypothetical protein